MSGIPQLPDLAKLTDVQKDELIVSLWQTVLALEGGGEQRPVAASALPRGVDELRSRIGRTAASAGRGRRAAGTASWSPGCCWGFCL